MSNLTYSKNRQETESAPPPKPENGPLETCWLLRKALFRDSKKRLVARASWDIFVKVKNVSIRLLGGKG